MKLTDPTEDQINAAVAEHVAGWRHDPDEGWRDQNGIPNTGVDYMDFTRSADAVLPLLEKNFAVWSYHNDRPPGHFCADIDRENTRLIEAYGAFPLAACIALLRAKGIEVVFTK
jgi:hypothetical protein